MSEKVVVIDAGGRGHALARKYLENPNVQVVGIPGNDFWKVGAEGRVTTYPDLKTTSTEAIEQICTELGSSVALVDVAQDNAVAVGTVNILQDRGIPTLGPTKEAGRLEWSKFYTRNLAKQLDIPQPKYRVFHSPELAIKVVTQQKDRKRFIKGDGLLEGKGAWPARNKAEAIQLLQGIDLSQEAWKTFLLEEWMEGDNGEPIEEFSLFTLSDGTENQLIGTARDHKRVNDNDEGANTGGMGCSTPHSQLTEDLIAEAKNIQDKFVQFMADKRTPYVGIMYGGYALVRKRGKLEVGLVEINSRWGDPEAQVLVPGIKNDFLELGLAAVEGNLDRNPVRMDDKARVAVAGVSKGYPGDYSAVKDQEIHGLGDAMRLPDVTIIGAGIKVDHRKYTVNGGRLFYAVGEGIDVADAQSKAYEAIERVWINGDNLHYRTDIGDKDS